MLCSEPAAEWAGAACYKNTPHHLTRGFEADGLKAAGLRPFWPVSPHGCAQWSLQLMNGTVRFFSEDR